jgi:hypothetical protein
MIYNEGAAFSRDLKRLAKKWRTIPEDIEVAKGVTLLELFSKNDKARKDEERIRGFFSELPLGSVGTDAF